MPRSSSRRRALWWIGGVTIFALATVGGLAAVTAPAGSPGPTGAKATTTPTTSPTPARVVAFLGDSYTVGTGADIPQHGYVNVFAAALGYEPLNFGIGGTGYATPATPYTFGARVAQVAASHPALVIVQGSINDAMNYTLTPQQIQAAATSTLQALKTALPSTRIIVVGPAPTPANSAAQVAPDTASVAAAAAAIGLEFIDTTGMLDPADPSLWAPDGVHPDTAGHAELGEKLVTAYRALAAG